MQKYKIKDFFQIDEIIIDTHILIRWLSEPTKIKKEHLDIISNPDNTVFMTVASLFEITIKVKLGKLEFQGDYEKILLENGFEVLPLPLKHIEIMSNIEFSNKEPFELATISQAVSENYKIISYDYKFQNIKVLKPL